MEPSQRRLQLRIGCVVLYSTLLLWTKFSWNVTECSIHENLASWQEIIWRARQEAVEIHWRIFQDVGLCRYISVGKNALCGSNSPNFTLTFKWVHSKRASNGHVGFQSNRLIEKRQSPTHQRHRAVQRHDPWRFLLDGRRTPDLRMPTLRVCMIFLEFEVKVTDSLKIVAPATLEEHAEEMVSVDQFSQSYKQWSTVTFVDLITQLQNAKLSFINQGTSGVVPGVRWFVYSNNGDHMTSNFMKMLGYEYKDGETGVAVVGTGIPMGIRTWNRWSMFWKRMNQLCLQHMPRTWTLFIFCGLMLFQI